MFRKKDYSNILHITQETTVLERKCIESGLRITPARRIILYFISHSEAYLTIEEIYQLNQGTDTVVSISSIYSNVKKLVDIGVIEKRQIKSKNKYYSRERYKPKDQIIDIESGKVIEFRDKELDKIKAKIIAEYGFDIDECHVEFYSRVDERQ
jgi:Fur family ferric uptake transcriptional regulator